MKFNPEKKETINKTIRLNKELVEKIFEEAGKRKLSFNMFVSQCIEFAIQNLEHEEKDSTD